MRKIVRELKDGKALYRKVWFPAAKDVLRRNRTLNMVYYNPND